MNTTKLIESLPPRIKDHVIEYQDVILKGGRPAMRVLLDCILSPGQKALLQGNKHIIGLECVAQDKYAPKSSILTSTWYERRYARGVK